MGKKKKKNEADFLDLGTRKIKAQTVTGKVGQGTDSEHLCGAEPPSPEKHRDSAEPQRTLSRQGRLGGKVGQEVMDN